MGNSVVSNSRNDQVTMEKPGDSSSSTSSIDMFMKRGSCKETWMAYKSCMYENKEDALRIMEKCMEADPEYYHPYLSAVKATEEQVIKDIMELEVVDEEGKRLSAFMEGGGCKEEWTALMACMEEAEKNKEDEDTKCAQHFSMLGKCVDSHSDYYNSIIEITRTGAETLVRMFEEAL